MHRNSEKFSLKLAQNSMKNVEKSRFLQKFQQKNEKVWQNFAKILSFERCKGVTIL